MKYYPIAVSLNEQRVVVAGGGVIAERKTSGLLNAGASVTVVAPRLTQKLRRLAKEGRIAWKSRPVRKDDIRNAQLLVAATSDRCVNETVSRWAGEKKILVNVVDKPRLSDFISPAVLRKGKGIIAVYTDGKDPVFSRDLKNFLKEKWDDFLSYRSGL